MSASAKAILTLLLCASLSSGCLSYRYRTEKPTTAGTALATVAEVAAGTLFAAVCTDSDADDSEGTCPSGAAQIMAGGIALGVAFDLTGLFILWLIRDLD